MDLILPEAAGIQKDSRVSDIIDIGFCPDAADTVVSGLILDLIDAGFLREAVHVYNLYLADHGSCVNIFLCRIIGCLDNGCDLFR